MYRAYLATLIIYLITLPELAAQIPAENGTARAAGIGQISATLSGRDALFANGAGLVLDSTSGFLAGYTSLFNLKELNTLQLGGHYNFNNSAVGLAVSRYGTGAHHQHSFSAIVAHRLDKVSLAVKVGMVQLATEGFSTRRTLVLSAGGITELIPNLKIGAYAYNLNASVLNEETSDKLPTLLQIGVNWQAVEQLTIYSEVEKELDLDTRLKTGLEYTLRSFLILRTGFSTQPSTTHAGLGMRHRQLIFDYAAQVHRYLGLRHHLTLGLSLANL
jgi:hypothetical protein